MVQQGDYRALTTLYHRYYRSLYLKAFKRVTDNYAVEEIVQDVFINLWKKSGELDATGNVKAYLYATLRNRVLHTLRTARNRAACLEKAERAIASGSAVRPLQVIFARETETRINEIIASLSPQCREAFLFSRNDELSYKEIASRMDISVNTVEKHIAKALRILREKLADQGDFAFVTATLILAGKLLG